MINSLKRVWRRKKEMMKEEIGFIHGVPENRDETWERQVNGATFVFSKTWEPKHKKFYYECHTKAGNGNGFYASSDLDIEELVNEKRFSNIVHMHASKGAVGYGPSVERMLARCTLTNLL